MLSYGSRRSCTASCWVRPNDGYCNSKLFTLVNLVADGSDRNLKNFGRLRAAPAVSRPIRPMDLTSGLRCGLRFASGSEHTDLTDRLFLLFSKVKIQLLQPQTPLTALFVVCLVRHIGARHSLLSEANGGRHSRVSDSSIGALQHFLSRNAITFFSPSTIEFFDIRDS